jgi:NAD(P)H dehydrogenase (quinone)
MFGANVGRSTSEFGGNTVAESVKKGVESGGGSATIYQVPEVCSCTFPPFSFTNVGSSYLQTLPQEVLTKMYAPPKPDYPIATAADLPQYDGFLVGYVPKRSVASRVRPLTQRL